MSQLQSCLPVTLRDIPSPVIPPWPATHFQGRFCRHTGISLYTTHIPVPGRPFPWQLQWRFWAFEAIRKRNSSCSSMKILHLPKWKRQCPLKFYFSKPHKSHWILCCDYSAIINSNSNANLLPLRFGISTGYSQESLELSSCFTISLESAIYTKQLQSFNILSLSRSYLRNPLGWNEAAHFNML